MKPKVLVTGASGQLGNYVVERNGDDAELSAADHATLDVGDRDQVLGAVSGLCPDIIINCAAWTAVDACEDDPQRAYRDNALSARFLNEAADRFGAHLLTISTDYVFDGTKDSPYHEWDETNPQSVYGASKLAGEREVDARGCIVRTAWVMGPHGNNMAKTVLGLLDAHDELSFVADQRGCPSFTGDLAARIWELALQRHRGVFHLTNSGAVSWFEFVRSVAELSGQDPERIKPITTAQLDPPRPAPRPANSVLENRALAACGFEPLRDFREPLAETIAALNAA
jgi:dTDP-4-dehydrorhamnose reductase